MKVLFLTKYYPPSEGGIERYGHLLCTGLAERGVHVEVVAALEGGRRSCVDVVDDVWVHRMGSLCEVSGAPVSPGLLQVLRKLVGGFDLVHLNFPNPWAELTYMACCRRRKAVLTYHSDIFRQKVFLKAYRPFVHRLLDRMSAIIATSPNYVASSPFLSHYRERCRVIPLPVDTAGLASADPTEVEAAQGRYGKFVLFVGRFVYYKGLSYLIEAIGRLEGVHLVVAGRGPLESVHRMQVDRLGLSNRISFLGKVPDPYLITLYSACRCLVLPSVARSEAFGMVLGEAMACGTPVISTELSTGTSYVNLDGQTGFVVPPRNATALAEKIDLLVRDEILRADLGRRARQRVEQEFRKEATVEKTLRLYEEVLGR